MARGRAGTEAQAAFAAGRLQRAGASRTLSRPTLRMNARMSRERGTSAPGVTMRLAAAVAAALALACASGSPAPTGSVRGVAVDDSGHGLPGITVTIQTAAGKIVDTVVTAPDGSYEFPAVPAGEYRVMTYFRGFQSPEPLSVSVAAGAPNNLPPLRLVAPDAAAETGE